MAKRSIIYDQPSGGILSDAAEIELMAAIAAHADKQIRITVERKRKKRSLEQNAFMHGPFFESLTEMYRHFGHDYDEHLVKDLFKRQFGVKIRIENIDGSHYFMDKPTRDYSTQEAEDCMETCRRFYAQYWQLPYPHELTTGVI